jgi:hypothetical protein
VGHFVTTSLVSPVVSLEETREVHAAPVRVRQDVVQTNEFNDGIGTRDGGERSNDTATGNLRDWAWMN